MEEEEVEEGGGGGGGGGRAVGTREVATGHHYHDWSITEYYVKRANELRSTPRYSRPTVDSIRHLLERPKTTGGDKEKLVGRPYYIESNMYMYSFILETYIAPHQVYNMYIYI